MSIFHPIYSVLMKRPELVMDHVAGYAALVQEEATSVGTEVAKRGIAWAVVAFAALVFVLLAGVAAMLWGVHGFHVSFLLVPAIPAAVAAVAFNAARKQLPSKAFAELRAQLDADAQALRTLSGKP